VRVLGLRDRARRRQQIGLLASASGTAPASRRVLRP
jgi:hypothetical protein